jgi:hypothetical protein
MATPAHFRFFCVTESQVAEEGPLGNKTGGVRDVSTGHGEPSRSEASDEGASVRMLVCL